MTSAQKTPPSSNYKRVIPWDHTKRDFVYGAVQDKIFKGRLPRRSLKRKIDTEMTSEDWNPVMAFNVCCIIWMALLAVVTITIVVLIIWFRTKITNFYYWLIFIVAMTLDIFTVAYLLFRCYSEQKIDRRFKDLERVCSDLNRSYYKGVGCGVCPGLAGAWLEVDLDPRRTIVEGEIERDQGESNVLKEQEQKERLKEQAKSGAMPPKKESSKTKDSRDKDRDKKSIKDRKESSRNPKESSRRDNKAPSQKSVLEKVSWGQDSHRRIERRKNLDDSELVHVIDDISADADNSNITPRDRQLRNPQKGDRSSFKTIKSDRKSRKSSEYSYYAGPASDDEESQSRNKSPLRRTVTDKQAIGKKNLKHVEINYPQSSPKKRAFISRFHEARKDGTMSSSPEKRLKASQLNESKMFEVRYESEVPEQRVINDYAHTMNLMMNGMSYDSGA